MTVLVTFASARGSTRSVAERIAAKISQRGRFAVAAAVDDVATLAPYDAVVIGSAVHDQRWLPKAIWFLADHAEELARRPVWLFSVGMPAAVGWPWRRLALREGTAIQQDLASVVTARGHRLFSGVVTPETFPQSSSRMVFRLMGCRYGDFRDWPAIDRWAVEIADALDNRTSAIDVTDAEQR